MTASVAGYGFAERAPVIVGDSIVEGRVMYSLKSRILWTLVLLPLASQFAGTPAAAQSNPDEGKRPDLVITEDTQLALKGRNGKVVLGSCQTPDPLWKGKIAIKNIGAAPVIVEVPREPSRLEAPTTTTELVAPHLRVYVPNNIELKAEAWLTHTLGEFGQELLDVEIGTGEHKCRNYGPPPLFDSRLSGRRGRVPARGSRIHHDGPKGGPGWRIKRIQRALIEKGYELRSGADGDYGWETAKAVLSFLKDRGETPPPEIRQSPLSPKMIDYLLDLLDATAAAAEIEPEVSTGDECIKGVNHVPVYVEIDPERRIPDENRANNRVQFTVEIDCSSVAGR